MAIPSLLKFLYFTSIVIWLFPPLRQFRGKYFFFFLILALIDPVSLGYGLIFRLNLPIQITTILVSFLLISLFPSAYLRKNFIVILAASSVFIVLTFFALNHMQNFAVIVLLHLAIFLIVLKNYVTHYALRGRLSLFYFFFIFYELTVIIKILNVILGFADATAFYILTSITQIIFGLFFSIYREDDSSGDTV